MTATQYEYFSLYAKGYTVTQIARACNKGKSTISSALKRAMSPGETKASVPCRYSPSCFTCPMRDCVIKPIEALTRNVI